jgi:hypothetical protein
VNRRDHKSLCVESEISSPEPRVRLTCFVDPVTRKVELRMAKGPRHQTIELSAGAFEYLANYVQERLSSGEPVERSA